MRSTVQFSAGFLMNAEIAKCKWLFANAANKGENRGSWRPTGRRSTEGMRGIVRKEGDVPRDQFHRR